MTDRPIIYSAPMVRALLAGRKTQTRRLCAWLNNPESPPLTQIVACDEPGWFGEEKGAPIFKVPFVPGDRLWVRESLECANGEAVGYPADGTWLPNSPWRWKRKTIPSIYMPRWASRITQIVTDVRVERLQDISREDAIAEGVQRVGGGMLRWENWSGAEGQSGTSPKAAYALLWNSINGPGSWDANPYVVAISFETHHCNIDRLEIRT